MTYVPREIIHRQEPLKDYSPPLTRSIPYVHNLEKAEHEFGFQTTPVKDWIQLTVDWYRDNYEGGNSKGYEYRQEELDLAAEWEDRFSKMISTFSVQNSG